MNLKFNMLTQGSRMIIKRKLILTMNIKFSTHLMTLTQRTINLLLKRDFITKPTKMKRDTTIHSSTLMTNITKTLMS